MKKKKGFIEYKWEGVKKASGYKDKEKGEEKVTWGEVGRNEERENYGRNHRKTDFV